MIITSEIDLDLFLIKLVKRAPQSRLSKSKIMKYGNHMHVNIYTRGTKKTLWPLMTLTFSFIGCVVKGQEDQYDVIFL